MRWGTRPRNQRFTDWQAIHIKVLVDIFMHLVLYLMDVIWVAEVVKICWLPSNSTGNRPISHTAGPHFHFDSTISWTLCKSNLLMFKFRFGEFSKVCLQIIRPQRYWDYRIQYGYHFNWTWSFWWGFKKGLKIFGDFLKSILCTLQFYFIRI